MSGTVAIIAMIAAGAIRIAHALATKPPPQGMTESDRVLRQQYRVRPSSIARLPDGEQGLLIGTARTLHRTLTAPLSGRACLYYVVLARSVESSGERELFAERSGVEFTLVDASGSAIVDPARASVALFFDYREEVRLADAPSPAQRALLVRHGHSSDRSDQLLFAEAVLSIGERIMVAGAGLRRPDLASSMESDYRSAPPARLQLAACDAAPLLISSQYVR
jgi:hypothetical protein